MSTTVAQVDERFLLKFDLYSPYFTPSQRSHILTEALRRTVEKKYKEYQGTHKVSEELADLVTVFDSTPTNASYHTKPVAFKYLLDIRIQYASGKNKKARLYREGDADDVFEAASESYPKVINRTTKLEFSPIGATRIKMVYLAEPDAINVLLPAAIIPLPDKTVDVMIDEAVKIAAAIVREQNAYVVQDKEIIDNQ